MAIICVDTENIFTMTVLFNSQYVEGTTTPLGILNDEVGLIP